MKKIIIILICVALSSCKKNDDEQNLIYKQLLKYRNELKENSKAIEAAIDYRKNEDEAYKNSTKISNKALDKYEKTFEELKFSNKIKLVQARDSFNTKYKLFVKFDTSNYNNVSDTVFEKLMEIDFYTLKICFQNRYLYKPGCK